MTTEGTENHEPKTAAESSFVETDPDNANLDPKSQEQIEDPKASGTPEADGTDGKTGDEIDPEVERLQKELRARDERISKLTDDHAKSKLEEQIERLNANDERAAEADLAAVESGDMTAAEAKTNASDRKTKTAEAIEEASKPAEGTTRELTPEQVTIYTELAVAARVDIGKEYAEKYGVDADTLINDVKLLDPDMMERRALELKVEAIQAGTWTDPSKEGSEKEEPEGEVFDGGTGSASTSNIDDMSTSELIQAGLKSR